MSEEGRGRLSMNPGAMKERDELKDENKELKEKIEKLKTRVFELETSRLDASDIQKYNTPKRTAEQVFYTRNCLILIYRSRTRKKETMTY